VCHTRKTGDDYAEGYTACAEDTGGVGGFGVRRREGKKDGGGIEGRASVLKS